MSNIDRISPNGAKKTILANVDLLTKVVLGAGTLLIGFFTFLLNVNISDLRQDLDERRFGQDQINAAYDRIDKYLALETAATPRRCNAIVLYVKRLPDSDLVKSLMEILSAEATDFCVQNAATDLALADAPPSTPSGIESYQEGIVFARNSSEKTDITVYVCDNAVDGAETVRVATLLGEQIGKNDNFGSIKGSYWRGFDGLVPERGTITLVVDLDHPEANEVTEIEQTVVAAMPAATVKVVGNLGRPTRWSISVIACE